MNASPCPPFPAPIRAPAPAPGQPVMFGIAYAPETFAIAERIIGTALSNPSVLQTRGPGGSMRESSEQAYVGETRTARDLRAQASRIHAAPPGLRESLVHAASMKLRTTFRPHDTPCNAVRSNLALQDDPSIFQLESMAVAGPGREQIAQGRPCHAIRDDLGLTLLCSTVALERLAVNGPGQAQVLGGRPCRDIEHDLGLTTSTAMLELERIAVASAGARLVQSAWASCDIQHALGLTHGLAVFELELLAVNTSGRAQAMLGACADEIQVKLGLTHGAAVRELRDMVHRIHHGENPGRPGDPQSKHRA